MKSKLCCLWSVSSLHQQFLLQSMISAAMLLHLLTIPQMWIMFISKRSDLFPIIHIQEPWEPPQDVLGLCPPSDPSDWIWWDYHSTLLQELNVSKRSELMDEIIAYFNTQYPGAVPPSRKTIWWGDIDLRRHSSGFILDRWGEIPAFLAFWGDLKILNGYRKCAQMERARNSDSETHVEK